MKTAQLDETFYIHLFKNGLLNTKPVHDKFWVEWYAR